MKSLTLFVYHHKLNINVTDKMALKCFSIKMCPWNSAYIFANKYL